jgi:hypothetical protein
MHARSTESGEVAEENASRRGRGGTRRFENGPGDDESRKQRAGEGIAFRDHNGRHTCVGAEPVFGYQSRIGINNPKFLNANAVGLARSQDRQLPTCR